MGCGETGRCQDVALSPSDKPQNMIKYLSAVDWLRDTRENKYQKIVDRSFRASWRPRWLFCQLGRHSAPDWNISAVSGCSPWNCLCPFSLNCNICSVPLTIYLVPSSGHHFNLSSSLINDQTPAKLVTVPSTSNVLHGCVWHNSLSPPWITLNSKLQFWYSSLRSTMSHNCNFYIYKKQHAC